MPETKSTVSVWLSLVLFSEKAQCADIRVPLISCSADKPVPLGEISDAMHEMAEKVNKYWRSHLDNKGYLDVDLKSFRLSKEDK